MAGTAAVPKFGSWDAENIGYTVFFEKVRENKGTPAPAPRGDDYDFDPYEHYESLSRNAPSRPASSQGHGHVPPPHRPQHPAPQRGTGYHRRNGSNGSSAGSEVSSRGSKFSPPKPYQPHYGNNGYPAQHGGGGGYGGGAYAAPANNSYPAQHGGGGGGGYCGGAYAAPANNSYPAQHGGGGGGGYGAGAYGVPANNSYPSQQGGGAYSAPAPRHQHQHAPPRVAASPPRHATPPVSERTAPTKASRPAKPSAVPKFGVWDEQNATAAAQGFTVQFEKVKRHREVAKAAAPDVPPQLISPERLAAPAWQRPRKTTARKSFMSKMYGCLFPRVREGL